MADVKDQIAATGQKLMNHFRANDMKAAAQLYAEDCKLMPPGTETQHGRRAVEKTLTDLWASGGRSMELVTDELGLMGGDSAYERASYTVKGQDGSVVYQGKYVMIWKKIGGTWQIYIDINNNIEA